MSSERYFLCRETWIAGRLSRRLAEAMRNFPLTEAEKSGNAGLGLLCKVGFAMESDAAQKWTREEIDEISALGFCNIMLEIGAAQERDGFIEIRNIDADFSADVYNKMNAARMRESRKRKKEQQRANGVRTACEQRANACEQGETDHVLTACEQRANGVRIQEQYNTIQEKNTDNLNSTYKNENMCDNAHKCAGTHTRGSRPTPTDAEEVYIFMKNLPHCGLTEEEARHCASKFYDTQEAIGWVGPRGAALRDWKALARSFLTDWQNNKRNAYTTSPRKTRPVIDPLEGAFDDPDRF